MEDKSKNMLAVVAIAALIIGSAGGFLIGNMKSNESSGNTNASQSVEDVNSPAADLRVGLNNALREHVNLAGVALRNVYTKSPDADASVKALDDNSIEVAGLVGSVYGDQAEQDFLKVWRQHIGFFADYTVAAQKKDKAGMDKALEDLKDYGEAASTFFETANPNLPKSAVKPLLEEHRDAVIKTIDLIGEGDFDAAYKQLGVATDQVSKIADALAGGIEKQMPEKF